MGGLGEPQGPQNLEERPEGVRWKLPGGQGVGKLQSREGITQAGGEIARCDDVGSTGAKLARCLTVRLQRRGFILGATKKF